MAEEHPVEPLYEEPDVKNSIEDFQNTQADLKNAIESGNADQIREMNAKVIEASKNVLNEAFKSSEYFKNLPEDKQNKLTESLNDILDTLSNDPKPTLEKGMEKTTSVGKTIYDAIKYPFEKCYEGVKSLFQSPEAKVKAKVLEDARNRLNEVYENGTDEQRREALKSFNEASEGFKTEIERDTKANKEGESKYGERLWSLLKLLIGVGGLIAAFAIIAAKLNGCYQYKIGSNPLKLTSCDSFYKDESNRSYCGCGSPPEPPASLCNDTTQNYPYCKCMESGVHGQICDLDANSSSQIYYNYDDSHTAWSVAADTINALAKMASGVPDFLKDAWEWFKKTGYWIAIVVIIVVGLWAIVKVYNTYETSVSHTFEDGHRPEVIYMQQPQPK
jgi:hypothetical protein